MTSIHDLRPRVVLNLHMDAPIDCAPEDMHYVPLDCVDNPTKWEPRPCPQCAAPMDKWERLCRACYRIAHPREPRPTEAERHAAYLAANERRRNISRRRAKAHYAVSYAVRSGKLRPARECICVDCGAQAFCYDHRDYSKPLSVDPVCKRCDCVRGPGAPYDGADKRWLRRMVATEQRLTGISRHELRADIFGKAA